MKFEIGHQGLTEFRTIFTNDTLELEPNSIVCLVGCNGSGKSSAIRMIKENYINNNKGVDINDRGLYNRMANTFTDSKKEFKVEDYEFCAFDFSKRSSVSTYHGFDAAGQNEMFEGFNNFMSSTGEHINYRLGEHAEVLGHFIKHNKINKLLIFFDDCDAGSSIDMIVDFKKFFDIVIKDLEKRGIEYYIILTANSYELCKDYKCISVHDFKEVKFKDYEDYRQFVFESRKLKEESLKDEEVKYKEAEKKRKEKEEQERIEEAKREAEWNKQCEEDMSKGREACEQITQEELIDMMNKTNM